ncbi:MAG: 9-O-acetylesterase, partial [Candidatus Sumerlaeota bacterium]|nr:9-O-acetylesterase [Candidatus Sumerlaeota bacterium]
MIASERGFISRAIMVWAGCMLAALTASAEVKLPAIFGSHMVLQQDKPLTVWGWAQPGEAVTVQLAQEKKEAKANPKGEWKVALSPLKAGGPHEMTVTGSNTIKLDDILVGEVWVCSGQSNMEMGVKMCLNADQEAAAADYPKIRLLMIPKVAAPMAEKDVNATWKVCSPTTIVEGGWGGFSAAAYYFGREIYKTLGVPVGLVAPSWGGTRIEPWTAPEGFAAVPALQKTYELVMMGNPRTAQHKQRLEQLLKDTETWMGGARKALTEETAIPAMPTYPQELQAPLGSGAPTTLYNGMVYPIVPLAVRGAIWYQGESNHNEKDYKEKTEALVGGWRKVFGQDDLTFLYVQIAPYLYGSEASWIVPEFWEQQTAALAIPNTGMVVTTDIGDVKDIHPKNKQEVGRRLALLALAKTYGKKDIVCSGPSYKSLVIEGNKIRLTFDNVGGGLAARGGKPLDWFEVIDADEGGFVKAQAEISGANSVVVSAPEVKKPVAVRFAWSKIAEPALMNKEGLPAIPFRAGNAPNRDPLALNVPESKDYKLVYDLDLGKAGAKINYDVDNSKKINQPFDRVAYFIELQPANGETQYAYVSMDAFTDDLGKIGVPTVGAKANFQQDVKNMNVISNAKGVANGMGLEGGNIEFWPNNYGPANAKKVKNASEALLPVLQKAKEIGSKVGIYNHGGWGGEPENMVAVCEYLRKNRSIENVGIVYN